MNKRNFKKIRLYLVFFCGMAFFGCKEEGSVSKVSVVYEADKAVSVSFDAAAEGDYKIYVQEEQETAVLGAISTENGSYRFVPVVAFERGGAYEIRMGGSTLAQFQIASDTDGVAPELIAIYPSTDTVPENLLKMYLQFSQPMQEVGNALDFIKVIDNTEGIDNIEGIEVPVFLSLETELWNKEHTRLTLWLDPGRIKTDLIPNTEKGLPILEGHEYSMVISKEWKNKAGIPLTKDYTKQLRVGRRDARTPDISNWRVEIPKKGGIMPLTVYFMEPLDAVLLEEAFEIRNSAANLITGTYKIINDEKGLLFIPDYDWIAGSYTISVAPVLEDLAGNNLERLFDTDLQELSKVLEGDSATIPFTILE